MSTVEEREENDKKVDFIQQLAAGENQDAANYLNLLATAARITDDLVDGDKDVSQNSILSLIEILFVKLPSNPFYLQHRDLLFSQHLTMWNAWEASNVLEKGDSIDKIYAHVLRDYINEILPIVALLTQGHNKMKEVNGIIRGLFKKPLED